VLAPARQGFPAREQLGVLELEVPHCHGQGAAVMEASFGAIRLWRRATGMMYDN
jgi:hypothetical protein